MLTPPAKSRLPRFTAMSVRLGATTMRRWVRWQLWSCAVTLMLLVAGLTLLFGLGGQSSFPISAFLPFPGLMLVFGIGSIVVLLARLSNFANVGRALIRSQGSLCVKCHSVLPSTRPLPDSITRQCCRTTGELLHPAELQEWWDRWLTARTPSWGSAWRNNTDHLVRTRSPRRLVAFAAVGTIAAVVLLPLLIATFKVLTSKGGDARDVFMMEALSSAPGMFALGVTGFGFFLFSIGMAWSAERGPFCAKCGYRCGDTPAPRCPECGGDWRRPASLRVHRVIRNHSVLAGGVLVAVLGVMTLSGLLFRSQPTLVPTNLLISLGDFRTPYCPRVASAMARTLTPTERHELAERTIEAIEQVLDEIASIAEPASRMSVPFNYGAVEWLAQECAGAHGATDPAMCARARSLVAPLAASIVTSTSGAVAVHANDDEHFLRLEGRGVYLALRTGTGASLRLAFEQPTIEPANGLAPTPRWGEPLPPPDDPPTIVRSGHAVQFAIDHDFEFRRIDLPLVLPSEPGRYLLRARFWVIADPVSMYAPLLDADGHVAVPPGGWAERFEHRLILDVPTP